MKRLVERLNDVLDIVATAETHFAQTEEHRVYYGDRHAAVAEAVELLDALFRIDAALTKAHHTEGE